MGGKGKKKRKAQQGQQQKSGKKGFDLVETVAAPNKPKGRPGQSVPVPGLSNLGNTCFFNSVMQNLAQSHYFRVKLAQLVDKPTYSMEIKLKGRDGSGRQLSVDSGVGQLTVKLSSFLTDMQAGGRVLNPKPVFSEICKKAPRFSGYHQQDSQELLRCLLDALRTEEINRIKRAILTSYNVAGDKKEHDRLTDSDRTDIRAYGLQAHLEHTFVDSAFGGVLTSTVVCKECSNKSTMHETFLDLSLPIGEDKNMTSLTSPVGYQTRSKSKKKSEPSLPKAQPELSRHQLRKQEKQAKKAARKATKKNAHRAAASPEPNPEAEDEDAKGLHREEETVQEGSVKEEGKDEQSMESEQVQIDASTQNFEVVSQLSFAEEQQCTTPGELPPQPADGEVKGQSVSSLEVEGYAADGPLPDSRSLTELQSRVDTNGQEVIAIDGVMDQEEVTTVEVREEHKVATAEEAMAFQVDSTSSTESVQLNPSSSSTSVDTNSLIRNFQSLKVEPDSLEASLKKFCTPELLTGANKFACVVCTKLKAESQLPESPNTSTKSLSTDFSCVECTESTKAELVEIVNPTETSDTTLAPLNDIQGPPEASVIKEDGGQLDMSMDSMKECAEGGCEDDNVGDVAAIGGDEKEQEPEESEQGDQEVRNVESQTAEGDHEVSQDNNKIGSQEARGSDADSDVPDQDSDEGVANQEDSLEMGADADNEESSVEDTPSLQETPPKEKGSSIVFCEATKQMLIERPPPILTLHLKRFIQHGRRLQKNNKYVSFPTILDMQPFCVDTSQDGASRPSQLLYSLYGIVEHSGSMHGGHYVAYVRMRSPPKTTTSPSAAETTTESSKVPTGSPGHAQKDASPSQKELSTQDEDSGAGLHTANPLLNFDLSSTRGQWYYISDSHVRTASETEVLKSQAYLLFYEQLPMI